MYFLMDDCTYFVCLWCSQQLMFISYIISYMSTSVLPRIPCLFRDLVQVEVSRGGFVGGGRRRAERRRRRVAEEPRRDPGGRGIFYSLLSTENVPLHFALCQENIAGIRM